MQKVSLVLDWAAVKQRSVRPLMVPKYSAKNSWAPDTLNFQIIEWSPICDQFFAHTSVSLLFVLLL